MTRDLYLNKVIIPEKAGSYQQLLLADFAKHKEYKHLANSLFYPEFDIAAVVSGLHISNFYSYQYTGPLKQTRLFCDLEYLDKTETPGHSLEIPGEEYFFSERRFESAEQYSMRRYPYYYVIPDDFVHRIDDIFFKELTASAGYSRSAKGVVSKKISDKVSFEFNARRRDFHFVSIENYKYPDLSIVMSGENYRVLDIIDVKSLLFLPAPSFHFFYHLSNIFIKNDSGQVVKVERRTDEPITFYDEKDGCLIITNSAINKRRYVKFISFSILLLTHYLSVFEEWVKDQILPETDRLEMAVVS